MNFYQSRAIPAGGRHPYRSEERRNPRFPLQARHHRRGRERHGVTIIEHLLLTWAIRPISKFCASWKYHTFTEFWGWIWLSSIVFTNARLYSLLFDRSAEQRGLKRMEGESRERTGSFGWVFTHPTSMAAIMTSLFFPFLYSPFQH